MRTKYLYKERGEWRRQQSQGLLVDNNNNNNNNNHNNRQIHTKNNRSQRKSIHIINNNIMIIINSIIQVPIDETNLFICWFYSISNYSVFAKQMCCFSFLIV